MKKERFNWENGRRTLHKPKRMKSTRAVLGIGFNSLVKEIKQMREKGLTPKEIGIAIREIVR